MINEIFENLRCREIIKENLAVLKEGHTWEQIALALYQILDDIDTMSDACKEDSDAFRSKVMKLQARKNRFLFSPDGYINEAVSTKVDPQQKLLKKYKNKVNKLTTNTYSQEESHWIKFWMLTDGKIISVGHTHGDTAVEADVLIHELTDVGAIRGYINPTFGELNVESNKKFTRQQIITLVGMFVPYHITHVFSEIDEIGARAELKSSKELEYFLTYGTLDEHIDGESNDGNYEKGGYDSSLKSGRNIGKYPPPPPDMKPDYPKLKESLSTHAERELELAGLFDKDSDYEGMLAEAVLELMELFAKQVHSGFSATLTADLFGRLAKFEALTELTDNPDEWNSISEYQDGQPGWQSQRSPSCFSEDGGKTYYNLDELAVEHGDEDGVSYQTYDGKKVMHTSKAHMA